MRSSPVVKTAKEFSDNSTIHGVGYLMSTSSCLADRLMWFCLICLSLSLASYLSITAYGDWQASMVTTTLSDTTKPVSELPFPAVTICTEGLNMDAVNTALAQDFLLWLTENNIKYNQNGEVQEENLQTFLE